jgi:hypothetical protein
MFFARWTSSDFQISIPHSESIEIQGRHQGRGNHRAGSETLDKIRRKLNVEEGKAEAEYILSKFGEKGFRRDDLINVLCEMGNSNRQAGHIVAIMVNEGRLDQVNDVVYLKGEREPISEERQKMVDVALAKYEKEVKPKF